MTKAELTENIKKKESCLCVGLDTDIRKIPSALLSVDDPVFEFNRRIIDATHPFAVAYKPNIAFYESQGSRGWESLQKTIEYIPDDCFTIADAKRGDIGNTSLLYARTFFETYQFDAVTVAPYMGSDSVKPFLEYKNKWTIILGLTSNPGSEDFQLLEKDGQYLFEKVIADSSQWGNSGNTMYVAGATQPQHMLRIRRIIPDHFLLVPGVGAQGGSLEDVFNAGANHSCGLLINSSRQIIFASAGDDFAEAAGAEAKAIREQMKKLLNAL
jgi:orotidine-5'-phosphate decarboxylase